MAFNHQQLKGILSESGSRRPPLLPVQRPSSPHQHRGFFKSATPLTYRRTAFILVAITSALLLINTAHVQFSLSSSAGHRIFSETPYSRRHPIDPRPLRDYEYDDKLHAEEQEMSSTYPTGYNEAVNQDNELNFLGEDAGDENEDEERQSSVQSNGRQRHPPARISFKTVEGIVSKDAGHDQYFRHVAGPDDFYFLMEGAQRLALGAHLVSNDLLVDLDETPSRTLMTMDPQVSSGFRDTSRKLVYRADFRMALPGPVQLSGWLTYEKFRAVRENRPGVWPQWSHSLLIDPGTKVDPSDEATGVATKFTICSACEMDTFLEQSKEYREAHFEQCDRMAPARGSYWREDLALRLYSELDTVNRAPGAGANVRDGAETMDNKHEEVNMQKNHAKLTRGWRFVPNGCTMTRTSSVPNASSQDPYMSTCDSIASPGAMMRSSRFQKNNDTNSNSRPDIEDNSYPRRRILFMGDSQVRTTYNAILNHYRPVDPEHQRFSTHDEFVPGLETLDEANVITATPTAATVIPRSESDTEIELIYKADQFLDFLVNSKNEDLDRYDTIYLNLGQWPASGPVAGGQWSTAKLLERWEAVIERLDRWKRSREEQLWSRSLYSDEIAAKNPTFGSGESSRVIWAGMNAFPMRTDQSIRVKGDWRTNARLGHWDDWIETISQDAGGWFRRMNAWHLTFPMLDQVVDKAHFQETDAIDALKIEALYKLDLCSRMTPDIPYSSMTTDITVETTTNIPTEPTMNITTETIFTTTGN
ncbi:hypothetical protein BGZ65_001544 [Modicella reniformis]|uniref:Uncharacterized protein n=1 Tax=Modicella reniformis TaxID=1440133 RepID=A0A9P6ML28_9FUNG|nr:hypothetical protein BGZ65_001544 [Modicella reniformis]